MSFIKRSILILSKDSLLPLIAGVASSLYPWSFYYTKNFNFVNSWEHFYFFASYFFLIPTAIYYLFYVLLKKNHLNSYKKAILPFLNSFVFLTLLTVALYAELSFKKMAVILVLALLLATACVFRNKLFTKLLVIEFLLLFFTLYSLAVITKKYVTNDLSWLQQADQIEKVTFKKTPNVYVIQPDGYLNYSELSKGLYQYDNSEFESWLDSLQFFKYPDFRSNYSNTLASNSSMFAMKHHYYKQLDERKSIMDLNPVVKIFNSNGYTTHFYAETPYLITNRPKISFDTMNFNWSEIPFLSKGLSVRKDILNDLPPAIKEQKGSNFYFFEKLLPGHVTTYKDPSKSIETERERYLIRLSNSNKWQKDLISIIIDEDPDALIIIVADHGGYVGWEYTQLARSKVTDRDLLYSAFSSALAIKWPENVPPDFEHHPKTSVNLFRILIAYLAEDTSFLKHLQEDNSYMNIYEGAPKGTYKTIHQNGNVVFEKHRFD